MTDSPPKRIDGVTAYACAVLAFNLAVVAWGAYVRASGSGAGCGSHWPLCNGTVLLHSPRIETLIEFTHRATSGLAATGVFALAVWTFLVRPSGHPARSSALTAAVLMVVEALLGASLVLFGWVTTNTSWARVTSLGLHLVNTFLLLAALAVTAWRLSGAPGNRWRKQGTDGAIVGVMLGLTLLVGLTGAITSLGDTLYPSASIAAGMREDFAATSHFITRLRVVHPALALFTALVASLSAAALARRRPSRDTTGMARIARTLIVVQIIGGFVNLALLAPVWMQLVHLMLADFTWLSLVLLGATALAQQPNPKTRNNR